MSLVFFKKEEDGSNSYLAASFEFENFIEAFAFMTEVAFFAEKQGHHPDWSNVYNTVNIRLNTHDAGDIVTKKDEQLAATIEKIYTKRK